MFLMGLIGLYLVDGNNIIGYEMINKLVLYKWTLLLSVGTVLYGCGTSKSVSNVGDDRIIAAIDLVNVVDDRVMVTIDPGRFTTDKITFYIPKTVPGTYSEDDYGKYIEEFKALDYKGKELSHERLDDNSWMITNATDLDKVTYWVNDTYDTETEVKDKVFSPAGTNILKGKNYMLNLHGFVGYFNGLEETAYILNIKAPDGLEPMTSLGRAGTHIKDPTVDVFNAARYFEVIDNPILYAKPDTETFQVGDIEVSLSVYSPNGHYTAASLKGSMETMMGAQKRFLGAVNSTRNYTILLYLSTMEETDATGFGALEHHTSTVVVLPEQMPKDRLEETLIDIVSHEFFHIVTPLTIHSGEIHFFNFNEPKMSQHLWMYEGTTEYFANLFQIQQGLITEEAFYTRLMEKVGNAQIYDDTMSFTELSKHVFESPYKENYGNVYEKGALISMALDIRLRELSDGQKGVLWLMKELSKKYGNATPFADDTLIDEIVGMTYPEIEEFFAHHVVGNIPIDYELFWQKLGLEVVAGEEATSYFFKGEIPFIDVDTSQGNEIFVRKGIALNSFFNDLGIQGGDIIKEIDGTVIDLETIRPIIGLSFGWKPEREISILIQRGDDEILLSGKVGVPTVKVQQLMPVESATEKQLMLREAWLKG